METTKQTQTKDAREAKRHTLAIIRRLVKLYHKNPDANDDEWGNLYELGLSFGLNDSSNTLERGEASYWSWVICTGGPHSEFRFYRCEAKTIYRVEFVYIDWYFNKKYQLKGKELELLLDVFELLNGGE